MEGPAAIGATSASPPATNAWTNEIGASASAARWKRKPVAPRSNPTRHQGERSIEDRVRSGRRALTGGRSRGVQVLAEVPRALGERRAERERQADHYRGHG